MIRTQISLEPEEVSWLKREAKARGKPMAAIIRDMIHNASVRDHAPVRKRSGRSERAPIVKQRHPWVGICKDSPPTNASLADEYLYGEGEAR